MKPLEKCKQQQQPIARWQEAKVADMSNEPLRNDFLIFIRIQNLGNPRKMQSENMGMFFNFELLHLLSLSSTSLRNPRLRLIQSATLSLNGCLSFVNARCNVFSTS